MVSQRPLKCVRFSVACMTNKPEPKFHRYAGVIPNSQDVVMSSSRTLIQHDATFLQSGRSVKREV